uniref:Uncharacterized protein n=1 Tax=Zea mays TaxID=4577 RepID=C0PIG4_MAIZE|nr:unknown [Zea mays]
MWRVFVKCTELQRTFYKTPLTQHRWMWRMWSGLILLMGAPTLLAHKIRSHSKKASSHGCDCEWTDRSNEAALEPVHEALDPGQDTALLFFNICLLLGLLGVAVDDVVEEAGTASMAVAVAESPPHDRLPEPPDHLFHLLILLVVAVLVVLISVAEPLPRRHILLLVLVVVVVEVEPVPLHAHALCRLWGGGSLLLLLLVLDVVETVAAHVVVEVEAEPPPQHLVLPRPDCRRALVVVPVGVGERRRLLACNSHLPLSVAVRERAIRVRLGHGHLLPRLPGHLCGCGQDGKVAHCLLAPRAVARTRELVRRVTVDPVVAFQPEVVVVVEPVRRQAEEFEPMLLLLRRDGLLFSGAGGARLSVDRGVG